MLRHGGFRGSGAFAVRRASKLDSALPVNRRLSNTRVISYAVLKKQCDFLVAKKRLIGGTCG
jgi:hypothetical protein